MTQDFVTITIPLSNAIAKQVVELHGGTVSATNASGGGAALELRFPA